MRVQTFVKPAALAAGAAMLAGCGGTLERGGDPQVLNSVIYRVKRAGLSDPALRADADALPNADMRCAVLRDRRALAPATSGAARSADSFGCFANLPGGQVHWIVRRDGSGAFTQVRRVAARA